MYCIFPCAHRMLFENKVKEIDNDGFKGLDSLESL